MTERQYQEFLERIRNYYREKNKRDYENWKMAAEKAAECEREACAKVCDEYANKCVEAENWEAEDVSLHCAAAIRARGLTKSNTGE